MTEGIWPGAFDSWLDLRLEIRPTSPISGRGTFAKAFIAKGEIITIWSHRILSKEQALLAPPGLLQERPNGEWIWMAPDDKDAPDYLINHSCNPNVWMEDEVTLSAMVDIQLGEELTLDYAVITPDEDWVGKFTCNCGSSNCRKQITGKDWRIAELQERYAGHFHPAIARRIAAVERDEPP